MKEYNDADLGCKETALASGGLSSRQEEWLPSYPPSTPDIQEAKYVLAGLAERSSPGFGSRLFTTEATGHMKLLSTQDTANLKWDVFSL